METRLSPDPFRLDAVAVEVRGTRATRGCPRTGQPPISPPWSPVVLPPGAGPTGRRPAGPPAVELPAVPVHHRHRRPHGRRRPPRTEGIRAPDTAKRPIPSRRAGGSPPP